MSCYGWGGRQMEQKGAEGALCGRQALVALHWSPLVLP